MSREISAVEIIQKHINDYSCLLFYNFSWRIQRNMVCQSLLRVMNMTQEI